jgi:AraC-like DNA-binding protein
MDPLAPLFTHFGLHARVFYSGLLCSAVDFDAVDGQGHLHVLRAGRVVVRGGDGMTREIREPSLLFYPRPLSHGFHLPDPAGASLVCATIEFGAGLGNPLLRCLPDALVLPLRDIEAADATLRLLFEEAFADQPGRIAAIDRLMEFFIILLLRHAIAARLIEGGVLAALSDARLVKATTALHDAPARDWTLASLAAAAGMSRARFAAHFHQTVGMTPIEYLTDWRIGLAQQQLRKGRPAKIIAAEVGYTNPASFARAFQRQVGCSPKQWMARRQSPATTAAGLVTSRAGFEN